jgi:hypothetical protein
MKKTTANRIASVVLTEATDETRITSPSSCYMNLSQFTYYDELCLPHEKTKTNENSDGKFN